jgi:hypothetical protein
LESVEKFLPLDACPPQVEGRIKVRVKISPVEGGEEIQGVQYLQ